MFNGGIPYTECYIATFLAQYHISSQVPVFCTHFCSLEDTGTDLFLKKLILVC